MSKATLIVMMALLMSATALSQQSDSLPPDTILAVDSLAAQAAPAALAPRPPANLVVEDVPNDAGSAVQLSWRLSPDDETMVTSYAVMRGESPTGPFTVIGTTTQGQSVFSDGDVGGGGDYYYVVVALAEEITDTTELDAGASASNIFGPTHATAQWFHMGRLAILVWLLVICGAILFFIRYAAKGKELYIRKIAGIEAVEEAIGRATEMGRKIFYVPGIMDMDDMQTVASIPILGRVAEIAARNDTYLEVPVCRSLVMVTAREAVREAYNRAGRPDAFQEDQVHYLTDDQFGYAAAIDGMVVREKPATIFYMGAFFAESLILAETGNAAGAIQIAGTAMPSQLPFFVTACDYTLIGEELFAASAYLSREPKLLGSLKGQDVGKGLFLMAIVVGIILELAGVNFLTILHVN